MNKPSIARVFVTGLGSLSAAGITLWVGAGDRYDAHHLAGTLLGFWLTGLIAARMFALIDRRDQVDREEQNARNRMHWERKARTGTWRHPDTGDILTVRWNQNDGVFVVRGHMAAGWDIPDETAWPGEPRRLSLALAEAERDGMEPDHGEPTQMIRYLLRLPGGNRVGYDRISH